MTPAGRPGRLSLIGAEREIDEPDESGVVTPLDEAMVEDGAQRLKESN